MRKNIEIIFILLCILPFPINAYANNDFRCTARESYTPFPSGELLQLLSRKSKPVEFVVNRATGIISGGGLSNIFGDLYKPQVQNGEPGKLDYKSITIMNNLDVHRLVIREGFSFTAKEMAFSYSDDGRTIYVGTCVYY